MTWVGKRASECGAGRIGSFRLATKFQSGGFLAVRLVSDVFVPLSVICPMGKTTAMPKLDVSDETT